MVKEEVKLEKKNNGVDVGEDTTGFKPGQRYPTPAPGAGDRVFYESLYNQRPSSFMALQWCLKYGVLPREECPALLKELEKRKKKGGSSVSYTSSPEKKSAKAKTKKRKLKHKTEAIGDAGMALGSGVEGIGTVSMM